jgi:hypothetical protein
MPWGEQKRKTPADSIPLYVALCLGCKENDTGTAWDDVSAWMRAHSDASGHTVALTVSAIHVDFTAPEQPFGREMTPEEISQVLGKPGRG